MKVIPERGDNLNRYNMMSFQKPSLKTKYMRYLKSIKKELSIKNFLSSILHDQVGHGRRIKWKSTVSDQLINRLITRFTI